MIRLQKGNIMLCASDSYILHALDCYFEGSLRSLREVFDLTGKTLSVHAYSYHMLNALIDLNLDEDESDAVILITSLPCHRILKGVFNYRSNVYFIDINNENFVVLHKLNIFIRMAIIVNDSAELKLTKINELLCNKIATSYFNGLSPSFISTVNMVNQKDVSKVKRKLMYAFRVKTTQELYIKNQLYRKVFNHYNFELI